MSMFCYIILVHAVFFNSNGLLKIPMNCMIFRFYFEWSEKNEKNLPAEEKTQKDGTRLQKKNVRQKRT